MPHRMSGKYEIHLTSLRYRGAPDSSMEDRIAPLRSVDHRQHSERHRAWGLAPVPQLPFFLTPGVETSCKNSLQCNGISRHNTPCYSIRGGALVPSAQEPIIPSAIWVSVRRARVLGFTQCWAGRKAGSFSGQFQNITEKLNVLQ